MVRDDLSQHLRMRCHRVVQERAYLGKFMVYYCHYTASLQDRLYLLIIKKLMAEMRRPERIQFIPYARVHEYELCLISDKSYIYKSLVTKV
jgi:hypothetical protein